MPPSPQDDSDGNIECVNEEKRLHKKVCNVSYPFFRAKAKVGVGVVWGGTGRVGEAQGRQEKWKGTERRTGEGWRGLREPFKQVSFFSHEMTFK